MQATRRNSVKVFVSVFFLSLFVFSAFGEHISFSADSMSGTIGDKSDATTLSGEASVITESMEIYADEIKMSGKDFRYMLMIAADINDGATFNSYINGGEIGEQTISGMRNVFVIE